MCLFKVLLLSSVVTAVVGTDTCPSSSEIASCPPSWKSWGHSCYRFTDKRANWSQSQLACHTMGGKMAVPYSSEENEFMMQMAQRQNIGRLWLGCSDQETEGSWVCEGQGEGEPFFDWMPGQPNDHNRKQHCIIADSTGVGHEEGTLKDVGCHQKRQALCTLNPCSSHYTQASHYCFATDTNGQLLINSCLLNHTIREFVTNSNPKCASACTKEPACRSFNIKHNDQGRKICQLNDATRSENPHKFRDIGSFCIYAQECVK